MTNILPRWLQPSLAAALVLALGLQGCNRDTPQKFIASGKAYLEKRDASAAVIQFKNAVQKDPNNAEGRYFLGVALEEADDPVAASIEFRKAIEAGYAAEIAYPALVRTLNEQGQFEKALAEAQSQERTNPAKAELLALSGMAQFGLGKRQEASGAFAMALSVDPKNDTATLGMAMVAASERDLPRASQLVDEVLARSPSSRQALLVKADVLVASQQGKEAAQVYGKVIDLRPHSPRVYLTLVPLLIREKDFAGAKSRLEALKKFARRAPLTQYLEALLAYSQGDRVAARDAIHAALNGSPDYVPALLLAGTIAHDSGDYAQAEEHLRKVVAATPNQVYPHRMLVSTYLRSGQMDRARDALQPLLQLSPNEAVTLNLAGEVALANREVSKAAEYYERALALDPNNASTRTRLGQVHLAAGDPQRAIQDLEAASSADPSQYQSDVTLLVLHLNRNELDKAQAAADALAKKQPNNPLTYNLAGLVKLAKKDQTGARNEFAHALQLSPTYFPAARNLALLDMRDGKPDAAKQRYEAILAKDAKNEQALVALVEVAIQTKAPVPDIEKAIDRAIAANPGSVRPRILKINFLVERGDPKSALTAAQQAQATLPRDPRVLEALGRAQIAAGEYDQAIATFGTLSSVMPKSPLPLLAQGQAYAGAKDWKNARKVIQKAADLQPSLVEARMGLVRVAMQSGRFEDARKEVREIQKQWPAAPVGYLAEAELLLVQKQPEQAERVLRDAIEKTKNPVLVVRLYALLNSQGHKKEAEAFASAWTAKNPNLQVDVLAGQMSLQRKDYAEAARWYRNVLKAQPNNVGALNNLAWALGQLQDPSALDYGQKALSLAPNAPAVLDTVGWLYVERGNVAQGLELLNKAHTLAPNTASIQLNLAKALIKAGQADAARKQLDVLAKLPAGSAIRDEAQKLLSTL